MQKLKDYIFAIFIIFLFLFTSICFGQTTAVQGTIIDSDGTTWFNAQVTVTWVPNSNYPNPNQYTYQGQPLTNNQALLKQTVISNASGVFNLTAIDSNQIQPAGSTYQFIIQSYTSAQSSVLPNLALIGSSQNVSSFLTTNIKAPRFAATTGQYGGAYGYNEGEISVTPIPGGSFFNVTSGTLEVWACTSSGCSWQSQTIGSFCSTVSCTIQALQTLNFNNTCEASTQAGADFIAQIIACENASYMATGGIITAYGYGNSTQTATTVLPSLGTSTQPIALFLGNSTKFIFDENVGTANNSSSCIIPIENASKIVGAGFVSFARTNLLVGNTAVFNDFVCNKRWDGTQEAIQLDGITLVGNANATKTGSLLHLVNIFAGSQFNNFATYFPYGPGVTVDSGSDITFTNSVIDDSAPSGQYPGALFTLNCPNRFTYNAGAIQDQGIFNPLIIINSPNSGTCNSLGGGGIQPFGVHFYNTDFEIQPATVGSFSGHATDVTPIQLNDPSDVLIDGLLLYGNRGSGQTNIIKITSNNGPRGPIEIDNLQAPSPTWGTADVLIKNLGGTFTTVAPQLQNVHGVLAGGVVTIGKYRWQGSNATSNNASTDYEDNKNFTSTTTNLLNIVPTIYSSLQPCNSALEGQLQSITDAQTNVPGNLVNSGSGTFHIQVYCNGTNWYVAAGQTTRLAQSFTICASGCDYNTTICSTNGSTAWAGGGCTVGTFNWPIPFANTNYSFGCMPVTPLLGSGQPIAAFIYNQGGSNKTTTGIAVGLMVPNAVVTTVAEIDCWGIHN